MKKSGMMATAGLALSAGLALGTALAQQAPPAAPAAPVPYFVGNSLGMPINPDPKVKFEVMSSNVKVYGSVYSAESCSYDPVRKVIVVPNRGVGQNVRTNDAWITFLNHDGSVHTSRWVGVQNAGVQRDNMTPPLILNEPAGSNIANGILYLADRDGGTGPNDPAVAVVRSFNMQTGLPVKSVKVAQSTGFNDLEASSDGTVYATVTGTGQDATTWQVWKITPDGAASIFAQGAPMRQPNGIAFDQQGNIVVVNIGTEDVITYSKDGKVVRTEKAAQSGNDGLVVMKDGTKYVSSVVNGGVSRIRPGRPAELIAKNIPNPASMCYDPDANQLVIPMNANNALSFIKLR
ncbi:MAG TPA: SMP-30/gluconolactonase/LRE family protein [Vicinamibacterales bacterium]|nr:SMP-30/gluconolactonase/LRE family protein [Vicinamibacterales bacterium]